MGTIIDVSKTVRIETHPERKKGIATKELLDNRVTHPKYQACRKATKEEIAHPQIETENGQRIFRDAYGKKIHFGQPMDYIDWHAPEDKHKWTVYKLEDAPVDPNDEDAGMMKRYMPKGTYATEAAAMKAAKKL